MPGGVRSWGNGHIWIKPSQVVIDGVIRDNFSIHSGQEAGSVGCIDLIDNDVDFFQKIEYYRDNIKKVKLIVKYP